MRVPDFYRSAIDIVGDAPAIFSAMSAPIANFTAWERAPDAGLEIYCRHLEKTRPQNTFETEPHDITFVNGETLRLPVAKALLTPGFEYLKQDIQAIGNGLIENVGLPVTFYPEFDRGQGLSSLRYIEPPEQALTYDRESHFHVDGLQDEMPVFAPDTPDAPSFSVTVIANYMPITTLGVKASAVAPVAQRFITHAGTPQDPSHLAWNDAIHEVTGGAVEEAIFPFNRYHATAFAAMPRGIAAQNLFDKSPSRVFAVHASPILEADDPPRLALIMRAQIGGFTR
ncbi:MAG TPA: hypothetical protein VFR09_03775 [Alphaproteobacteria bacterium]|nr:hypothetical protein [Alphaproteobacteria bacterium]